MWWLEITDIKNRKAIYLELSKEKCEALYQFISSISSDVPISYGYIENENELITVSGRCYELQIERKQYSVAKKPASDLEEFSSWFSRLNRL
ncbi:hypothetical protein [Pectobacterium atrosepticum]|uniref:hypothetical protein n=1 Tax=Pectobacterium atrosepticum TaxID=29471 RepID=UPI001BFC9A8C|nr:hypothetical protein [Pectobacterium atrosepticum]QWC52734.1 hypothetical protein HLB43_19390 [Pectobacterium atrosepticum]